MIPHLCHFYETFGAVRGRTCLIYCSLRMCFTSYGAPSLTRCMRKGPLTSVGATRTTSIVLTTLVLLVRYLHDQEPSSFKHASCLHVLHATCCASGRGSERCSCLGASLHPWLKLNAPRVFFPQARRVYHHVPRHVPRVLNPVKFGLRTGACAQTTAQLAKQAHGRRLSRRTRNRARALGVPIPQKCWQQSLFDKIFAAFFFDVRSKTWSPIVECVPQPGFVGKDFRSCWEVGIGGPSKSSKEKFEETRWPPWHAIANHVGGGNNPLVCRDSKHWKHYNCFAKVLYITIPVIVVQCTLFQNGRIKLQVQWATAPSSKDGVRTTQMYNGQLDSATALTCSCNYERFAQFPKGEGVRLEPVPS